MAVAVAAVDALAAATSTEADALIAAMEGMGFETPKGLMRFRREDHQALRPIYHFRIIASGSGQTLELVREMPLAELPPPEDGARAP